MELEIKTFSLLEKETNERLHKSNLYMQCKITSVESRDQDGLFFTQLGLQQNKNTLLF